MATKTNSGSPAKRFTIGRDESNDIVLPDGSSSSQHAILELQENGEYAVSDLGSTNHTQVNGKRITASKPLQHEDRILFGDTLAIYHATYPDAEPVYAEPAEAPPEIEVAPPPTPKKEKQKPTQAPAAPTPEPAVSDAPATPPAAGSGCLGLLIAAAIPCHRLPHLKMIGLSP